MNKGHDKGHKGQMSDREAIKLALEALVDFGWHIENCPQFPTWAEPEKHPLCTCGYDTAITALRQALEQPEQEPVAWSVLDRRTGKHWYTHESKYTAQYYANLYSHRETDGEPSMVVTPLYTAPPKREWVGLTDEEIQDFGYEAEKFDKSNSEWFDRFGFARAIEAKLKEKNT